MKTETAKTLALGLLAGALLMVLALPYTQAGPQPSPRVVPTVLQSVVPPSKTVSVGVLLHADDPAGVIQAPINLEPEEVFMLTAVTSRVAHSLSTASDPYSGGGLRAIRRGAPTGPIIAYARAVTSGADHYVLTTNVHPNFYHTTYPTGIRFARLPNGRADMFLVGRTSGERPTSDPPVINRPADLPDVTLHGYITTDF